MPRTRKTPNKPANNTPSRKPAATRDPLVWCNVRLSDDDVAYLDEQPATLADLGAMLLAVADEGYGFSVKAIGEGDNIMCAITGVADDDLSRDMGVSAFADNVRDAALACLYKFKTLCGGSFNTGLGDGSTGKRRFR